MNYRERVGININRIRKEQNITLKMLASKVGITEATMQKYEAGKIGRIDVDMVCKIANALNTTPEKITGWENKDEENKAHQNRLKQRELKGFEMYSKLSFEKQKKVDLYMKNLINGIDLLDIDKTTIDYAIKLSCIDDSILKYITQNIDTAYADYMARQKRADSVS